LWVCASWSGWAGPKNCAPPSWATRSTAACRELTHLAKSLFACDELSGFLTACALVKPTKAIADVEVASVRKKMKDKAFARGVNRADILQGVAELGVELDAHIAFCLEAMKRRAPDLGL
jgi:predicted hydrolase (HD superfamily)